MSISNPEIAATEAHEVLRQAADLIRKCGWAQGTYHLPLTGGYCIQGAIDAVLYGPGGNWNEATAEQKRLEHLCNEAIAGMIPHWSPVSWQDQRGRKKEEVLAALEKAAELAEAT